MDVTELLKQLGILAEKSPEARAFILALMFQLVLLAALMMFGGWSLVQRLRRRRNSVEPDADVTTPNIDMATALKSLADALLVNANTLTPLLKSVLETSQATEAGVAGLVAATTKRPTVEKTILENDATMFEVLDRIHKAAKSIRTRDEAATEKQQTIDAINTHTDEAVRPVTDKLDQHHELLKGMPDALVLKVRETMPPIVQEAFAVIIAERDAANGKARAAEERATQAEIARDMLSVKIDLLNTENADLTDKLRVANATIAALPKLEPPTITPVLDTATPPNSSAPTVPPPTGTSDAPEGVPA